MDIMKSYSSSQCISIVLLLMAVVLPGIACKSLSSSRTTTTAAKDPLTILLEGNKRFREDHPIHPDQTLERIRTLKDGQHPFAVIVSCSDSRLPPELIFDQGLGDLFVIRNAGNLIGDYELGSIEYAVEHLHTPLIIVLGHTQCGAIGAYIEHKHDTLHNHIQAIIDYLKAEPEEAQLDELDQQYYYKAVVANIEHGVKLLRYAEPVLHEKVANGELTILGALFNMDTGEVLILEE